MEFRNSREFRILENSGIRNSGIPRILEFLGITEKIANSEFSNSGIPGYSRILRIPNSGILNWNSERDLEKIRNWWQHSANNAEFLYDSREVRGMGPMGGGA
jgi:hypothetical protein